MDLLTRPLQVEGADPLSTAAPVRHNGGTTSHFLRFSLITLLGVLLVVIAIGTIYRMVAVNSLLKDREAHNAVLGRSLANALEGYLLPLVRDTEGLGAEALRSRPEVDAFEKALKVHLRGLPVVRVKVYTPEGVTVYATDRKLIGELQDENEGMQDAVQGETLGMLIRHDAFNPTDRVMEPRDIFESYLGFNDSASGKPAGVLEIYTDVTVLLDHIRVAQTALVFGSVVILGLFYLFLGRMYRRADNAIRSEEAVRTRHIAAMEEARALLEERVRERTRELDTSREFLQAVIDGIPEPVLVLGLDYRIRSLNDAARGLVAANTNPETLHCYEVAHGRDEPCCEPDHPCPFRAVVESGQPCTVQHQHRHAGELRHIEVKATPLRDQAGAITGIIEVTHDITDLVRTSERLRESETDLRTIMDGVLDAILTVDANGRVETANRGAARLFDRPPEKLDGCALEELIPSLAVDGEQGGLLLGSREGVGRCPGKEELPLEIWVGQLQQRSLPRYIVVARDITERRLAEQELEQTRRQYFHQEKMAAVGQLAAGIIHEVGNPIAAISGSIQDIREHHVTGCCPQASCPLDQDSICNLVLIEEQTHRLAEITRDIAEFASPRAENRQLLNLNDLVRGAVKLTRYDRRWQGIRLEQDLDPGLSAVTAVADKLTQVMINLLLNAADACEAQRGRSPHICVGTRQDEDGWVHLTVADNGEGMTGEMRDHAFDAFFTTKPPGKGTGLGLPLCQTYVEAHAGRIWLESERGVGTTVHIRLPASAT